MLEVIGIVEMLGLVVGLCTAKVAQVSVAEEGKLLMESGVFEAIKDKTSIVFIVVISCWEEVEKWIEVVVVVEAIGEVAGEFAPFDGGPGEVALGVTGGAGGAARTSSGRLKILTRVVPVPRMSRI
jgi:hypothetical protein